MTRIALAIGIVSLSLLAGGCQAVIGPDAQSVEELASLPYPAQAQLGPDLDILVRQEGGDITLSNRSPYSFADVQVWLNQQYVAQIGLLPVGPGTTVPASYFVNRYRESFPQGTLLAPDRGFPVVSAELFDPATGLRHRLITQYRQMRLH